MEEKYNLQELYSKLNKLIGENLTWEAQMKMNWHKEDYLYIESNDIKDKAGIMSCIYKSLVLRTFNSNFCNSSDRRDDDPVIWMTVNFSYDYIKGGSNGCDFATCYFMPDGHWVVKSVND